MTSQPSGFVGAVGTGSSWWFLETRTTVRVGRDQTSGLYTLLEMRAAPGVRSPRHVHRVEDEAFLVQEGAVQVECGDDTWYAGPGSTVFLPRRLPHAFVVVSPEPMLAWQLIAPAGYEDFVAALGEPVPGPGLPPNDFPASPGLIEVAAAHGIDIFRPLPST